MNNKYCEYKLIVRPWLIQRATISKPLAPRNTRFTPSVSLDYMGAAEFEFGALPESLRRLQSSKDQITIRIVPEIMEGVSQLRVLGAMDTNAHREYVEYLVKLRNSKLGEVHLKERTEFTLDETSRKAEWDSQNLKHNKRAYVRPAIDFWWDLDNDVMFSFNKLYMNRLMDHLNASWAYMDEQKAKK